MELVKNGKIKNGLGHKWLGSKMAGSNMAGSKMGRVKNGSGQKWTSQIWPITEFKLGLETETWQDLASIFGSMIGREDIMG